MLLLFVVTSRKMAKSLMVKDAGLLCVEHIEIHKAYVTKIGSCFNNLVKL